MSNSDTFLREICFKGNVMSMTSFCTSCFDIKNGANTKVICCTATKHFFVPCVMNVSVSKQLHWILNILGTYSHMKIFGMNCHILSAFAALLSLILLVGAPSGTDARSVSSFDALALNPLTREQHHGLICQNMSRHVVPPCTWDPRGRVIRSHFQKKPLVLAGKS